MALQIYGHLLIRLKTKGEIDSKFAYGVAEEVKQAIINTIYKTKADMESLGLIVEVIDVDDYGLSQSALNELGQMEAR